MFYKTQTFFMDTIDFLSANWKEKLSGFTGEELFEKYVKECHPFVFTPIELATPRDIEPSDVIQDLPYPIICVEVLNSFITVPQEDEGMKVWINSFIVREIAPREYEFLAFMEFMIAEDHTRRRRSSIAVVNKGEDSYSTFNGLLKVYLERLSKEKMGLAARDSKRKIGSGKTKQYYRPKNVTLVTPKKSVESYTGSEIFRDIDWTYRWEVRGHWRTVKGMGKDRTGNYCVSGHTWIPNHVRGPEDKPIMKKTYIVGE